jgi:uncharacterized membrane protein HdeD (DUF308 family)
VESQEHPPAAPEPVPLEAAPPAAPEAGQSHAPPKWGMAIAGLVCGVVALLFSIVPFIGMLLAPAPAILGIVFGAIGIAQANKGGTRTRSAIAGVVSGALALVIVVALMFATNGWT